MTSDNYSEHILHENFAKNFEQIYCKLNKPKIIAIALSGGSDSMALLHLANSWSKKEQIKIIALTVDHKLRSESSLEANEVASYCHSIGIEHHILEWNHNGIKTNIQFKAREARIKLLTNWCNDNLVTTILTAHHLGDQIEQLFISIAQGAGIYSFNIPTLSKINNIHFVRPLLDITKLELTNYLISKKIRWWEDRTNNDEKYLRNTFRPCADKLLQSSNKKRIITAFDNIQRAARTLTHTANEYIKKYVTFNSLGYCKFNITNFDALEDEIKLSSLRHIIIKIGRRESDIRIESLKSILKAIKSAQIKTLGGCAFLFHDKICIIIRDCGRVQIQDFIGSQGIWDNRFRIKANKEITISNIQELELNKLLKQKPQLLNFTSDLPKSIKKKIILTLPCIIQLEKLVAIPHIYYYDNNEQIADVQIEFEEGNL